MSITEAEHKVNSLGLLLVQGPHSLMLRAFPEGLTPGYIWGWGSNLGHCMQCE